MKFVVVIPARYASTRFPGKPLVLIDGKPMIQRVYEQCRLACHDVFVATDDDRIASVVAGFGGNFVMTSPNHPSGTDRCAEAVRKIGENCQFDVVVNVQGDEPFTQPGQILQLVGCFSDCQTDIATLVAPIASETVLFDENKVKTVLDKNHFALYFSRNPIPFQRDVEQNKWIGNHSYFLHLGMYAFRRHVLEEVTQLPSSPLERAEKLEQLRWLENGYHIRTALSNTYSIGIDTPDDLQKLKSLR